MLPATMSNSTSLSEEASTVSSGSRLHELSSLNPMFSAPSPPQQEKIKKKRNLPGNPDPDAEVIALSPKTLLATNRFVCEVCKKGFQRDQNLQLHRRGHNLPWKLRQRTSKEIIKKVYVCPEPSCIHHHPSRALGDLTGIKKHFCRKHGEKKWKCEKCSKRYAVQSDWKAHTKTCGTREYSCDCGTIFSRKDSFITHRAFCDALAEESARLSTNTLTTNPRDHHSLHLHPHQNPATPILSSFSYSAQQHQQYQQQQQHMMMMISDLSPPTHISLNSWDPHQDPLQVKNEIHRHPDQHQHHHHQYQRIPSISASPFLQEPAATGAIPKQLNTNNTPMSATALLQKAANVGTSAITGAAQAQSVSHMASSIAHRLKMDGFNTTAGGHMVGAGISPEYGSGNLETWRKSDRLTRDFLGLAGECCDSGGGGPGPGRSAGGGGGGGEVLMDVDLRDDVLSFDGVVGYPPYDQDESLLKTSTSGGFVFAEHSPETQGWGDC